MADPVNQSGEAVRSAPTEARRHSPRRYFLFIVCGGFTTVLCWGLYLLFLYVFPYRVAYTLAYAICIFVSYSLNATLVFKEKLRWRNALQYPLVALTQYLLAIGLLYVLVDIFGLSKIWAPWAVVVLTIPVTYQLSRYAVRQRPARTG